jgi:octaprenyl-diphosphate synthase
MASVEHIKDSLALELKQFNTLFKTSMASKTPLLDRITHYIIKRKGKQVRPMFVLLAAQTCGKVQHNTYVGASLIELLHTATLVHDDVVDESYQRRGFFSINALWKNKIAVLVGDYLLAKGLLLSVENKAFHLLEIVSKAVQQMSEGELLQIEKARTLDITEEVYYEVIRQKTASLIASCCACGAASTSEKQEEVHAMWKFGELVGMAFQIKDDLLDFDLSDTGKPKGVDIKEKKLTLPVIYALRTGEKAEARKIKSYLSSSKPQKYIQEITDFILKYKGFVYAEEKMLQFQQEALSILDSFKDSQAKTHLQELVLFTTQRKK